MLKFLTTESLFQLLCVICALLIIIVGLILRYRQILWRKNRHLVRQIKEQDRLAKFLEKALEEKDILQKHIKVFTVNKKAPPS